MQYDRVKCLIITQSMLEEYVDSSELNVPDFSECEITIIEEVVSQVREYWDLGDEPIRGIVYLLETKGFIISALKLDYRFIDAFGSQMK